MSIALTDVLDRISNNFTANDVYVIYKVCQSKITGIVQKTLL